MLSVDEQVLCQIPVILVNEGSTVFSWFKPNNLGRKNDLFLQLLSGDHFLSVETIAGSEAATGHLSFYSTHILSSA